MLAISLFYTFLSFFFLLLCQCDCACTHRVHLTKYAPPRTRCVHPYAPHESTTLKAFVRLACWFNVCLLNAATVLLFHWLVHRDGLWTEIKVWNILVSWCVYANGPFAYVSLCIVFLWPTFLSSIHCLFYPSILFDPNDLNSKIELKILQQERMIYPKLWKCL